MTGQAEQPDAGSSRGDRPIDWLLTADQQDYLDLFERMALDFGTRMPRNRMPRPPTDFTTRGAPLLTDNLIDDIRYGYGDPAVLWVREEQAWYLVATSNDAPNSFPILRTRDFRDWEPKGFVFPAGRKPAWAMDGPEVSDYWAPELHRVGGEYWLCFSAREPDGSLSIGMARAPRPDGPFTTSSRPLLRGGMIDAHIFVEQDGRPVLLWKEDSNALWPRLLVRMLLADVALPNRLFDRAEDRRSTAAIAGFWAALGDRLPQMQQFFLLQPLIEAVVDSFSLVRARLARMRTPEAEAILAAMRTPIYAQRLTKDGQALVGPRSILLVNDLVWEGHLIEGPWLTEQAGRFYLFYAGNDFSTHEYGIGAAVADSAWGPYRKIEQPLLRSSAEWVGPGHPSVAPGPGGLPHLFYHAFFPEHVGYKAFRALLTAPLHFAPDGVEIGSLKSA